MKSLLSLFAVLATVTPGCSSDDPPGAGKTYVLVHGAWMGADGWQPVADELRRDGAVVHVPELPAHGGDPRPASAATLAAYVSTVSEAIATAERPVILVGHSMAGVVITQTAEQRPADVAKLVYVAAYVPRDGQSLVDLAMTDAGSEIGPHLQFHDDGTVGVEATAFPELFCADCDADARAALVAGYRPEPTGPLGTPVTRTAAFDGIAKTYVHTAGDRVVSPDLQAQMVVATPMDRTRTLDTSHVPQLAAADALAEILLEE